MFKHSFPKLRETGNPVPAKAIRSHEINVMGEKAVMSVTMNNLQAVLGE